MVFTTMNALTWIKCASNSSLAAIVRVFLSTSHRIWYKVEFNMSFYRQYRRKMTRTPFGTSPFWRRLRRWTKTPTPALEGETRTTGDEGFKIIRLYLKLPFIYYQLVKKNISDLQNSFMLTTNGDLFLYCV